MTGDCGIRYSTGSSPRGRGTRTVGTVEAFPRRYRFIPARAGNTLGRTPFARMPSSAVHPRAGGEHLLCAFSSRSACRRFIPARAGNTIRSPPRVDTRRPVHPRAGGEHHHTDGPTRTSGTVHPRAGGEHLPWTARCGRRKHSCGSSPRGRGTRRSFRLSEPAPKVDRFIPARAGNTSAYPFKAGLRPSDRFIPARAGNTLLATD